MNSSGQSLASRSGGAIRSGHSYIDSLGYSSLLTSQHPNCTDELVYKRTKLSGCMAAWMRNLIRLLSAVAPFRFSLPSTLPLCGVGAQRPFAGVHATTDANLCFSYHKSSITPSWCCHVGYRDVLHVRPQKTLRSPFNERRIPVKTLLIHMFTASPDMNIGNKVWGY